MVIYYSDEQGNYYTDQNGNLYYPDINISEGLTKKYRPVIYKNGKFQRIKPYIGTELSIYSDSEFAFRGVSSRIFAIGTDEATYLIDNSGNILVNNDNYYLVV